MFQLWRNGTLHQKLPKQMRCDELCSPPTRDRGIACDRGKPRDLSLSYVARDRGNTRDLA
jgi:hypothetical protein